MKVEACRKNEDISVEHKGECSKFEINSNAVDKNVLPKYSVSLSPVRDKMCLLFNVQYKKVVKGRGSL